MTTVTTHHPARSDASVGTAATAGARPGRTWSLAGVGAGVAGVGTIVTSSGVNAVYDPDLAGDPVGLVTRLGEQAGWMFAFHSVTALGAVLLVVFAAGLHARLRASLPAESTLPLLAFAGLLGTAVVSVLGSGLDTEFMIAFAGGDQTVDASNAALYNHWIGTIPWVWLLSGLAGTAVYAAARAGAVPRWIGRVGLVLGGLTLLLGVSPLQYMAALPGVLWLLVTAVGFTVGDRAFRRA